jgi:hypothetical protein
MKMNCKCTIWKILAIALVAVGFMHMRAMKSCKGPSGGACPMF